MLAGTQYLGAGFCWPFALRCACRAIDHPDADLSVPSGPRLTPRRSSSFQTAAAAATTPVLETGALGYVPVPHPSHAGRIVHNPSIVSSMTLRDLQNLTTAHCAHASQMLMLLQLCPQAQPGASRSSTRILTTCPTHPCTPQVQALPAGAVLAAGTAKAGGMASPGRGEQQQLPGKQPPPPHPTPADPYSHPPTLHTIHGCADWHEQLPLLGMKRPGPSRSLPAPAPGGSFGEGQ